MDVSKTFAIRLVLVVALVVLAQAMRSHWLALGEAAALQVELDVASARLITAQHARSLAARQAAAAAAVTDSVARATAAQVAAARARTAVATHQGDSLAAVADSLAAGMPVLQQVLRDRERQVVVERTQARAREGAWVRERASLVAQVGALTMLVQQDSVTIDKWTERYRLLQSQRDAFRRAARPGWLARIGRDAKVSALTTVVVLVATR